MSGPYTLHTESVQVVALSQVAAPCSCRLLTHSSLLWHHHLGHPSLKRLRCMHSRLLVSSLLRSLPPPLPSLAPPLTLHSSFPLHTLHMEVWDPTPVSRSRWGHYFLLVVDDFTRYTTVFPLEHKGDIWVVLIRWIRAVCCQLSARFRHDLPVLRVHSDHGGKFSFGLLEDLCREEDITELSPRTLCCVFLGFPTDAPHWQFYHPATRRVLSSRNVTFDESVCYYCLFPHRSSPVPPPPPLPPLFLVPCYPPVDPLVSCSLSDLAADNTMASHCSPCLETLPSFPPQQPSLPLELVDVDSSAVGGGDAGGAGSGGAGSGVADSGVAERPSGGGVEGTTAGGSLKMLEVLELELLEVLELEVLEVLVLEVLELEVLEVPGAGVAGAGGSGARCTGARGAGGSGARGSGGLEVFELKVPTLEVQPHHVALPLPPSSSLSDIPDPVSDLARAASPSLVDFAATCPFDYHASLVFYCAYPPSIGGELALGCDVLEDGQFELECLTAAVPHLAAMLLASEGDPDALGIPTPRFYAEAITGQYSSHWQTAMDVEMILELHRHLRQPSRGDLAAPPTWLQITWDTAACTITLTPLRMVQQVLHHFRFQFSMPLSTPLPTGHSLSAPLSDESVEPSGPYPELVGFLFICTQPDLAYPLSILACYVAPGRHSPEQYWGATKRRASPPVLYVDNRAMVGLCWEQRLEHRSKHIALRYFLVQDSEQRGQLCLAYVALEANTADIFTKALGSGDHQRFCNALGLVPTLPHLLIS
ncbi:unnamed protein product [Closterium sp. NIES-53]